MLLLIDIGNTRIKFALSDGHAILQHGVIVHNKAWNEAIRQIFVEIITPIEACIVASVMAEQDNQFIEELISTCSRISPNLLKTQRFQCGLENAYSNPESMGVDRWLAMIAAWQKSQQAMLLIGCGSALTLDLVDIQGRHQGGYIIPGIRMMQNALNRQTALIDLDVGTEESLMPDWQWGRSTKQCVSAGSLLATVSVIDRAIINAEIEYPEGVSCFIYGGDAQRVQSYLRQAVNYEPDLVFLGMLNIYAELKGC